MNSPKGDYTRRKGLGVFTDIYIYIYIYIYMYVYQSEGVSPERDIWSLCGVLAGGWWVWWCWLVVRCRASASGAGTTLGTHK